ncbi:MAG: hypothetical protein M1816_000496 [Peltula sp. TS41687]|nr:MAG: hypothetical protein M1816_000496 [Peltula sp. TS41687]
MATEPRSPTIYFTWDFVQRSRHMLRELPKVRRDQGQRAAKEQFADAVGRCIFGKILINDTTGKLALMTGGDPSQPVDFGDEVKRKADQVEAALPQTF